MPVDRIELAQDLSLTRIVPGVMRLLEWGMSRVQLLGWIHACLELGITSFDHADIYGGYKCEGVFGEALSLEPSLREKIEIVTKCGIALLSDNRPYRVHHYITTRDHIIASAENSLKNFHTDYLDVLLIHRPDALMNADEVAEAMVKLRDGGKVRHFGVSNFMPFHLTLLQSRLDFPLVTNQIEFSVTHLDPLFDGTLDQAQELRHPPMIWSPLGGGSIFSQSDPRSMRVRATLDTIARQHGCAPDQVALAFVLQHPSRPIAVLGTGKIDRVRGAVSACEVVLAREEWFALWQASMGHEVP
jgi:predicted oxidoreductase